MEDSMGDLHKQERALRAIRVVATSGFVNSNRSLKQSCLIICNSFREFVPWRGLRIDRKVPPTLLGVLLPHLVFLGAEGASRVLLPQRVLRVFWKFDDPETPRPVKKKRRWQEEEEEEDEDEEEDEEEEDDEEADDGEEEDERGGEKAGGVKKGEEEEEEDEDEEKKQGAEEEDKVKNGPATACDVDMSKVRWPEGLKEIYLIHFNRPVDDVIWPECLEVLAFNIPTQSARRMYYIYGATGTFNKPIDGATFPAGLRELFLGHEFNQPIDGVALPEGLQRLCMPRYNQPIQNVKWPSGLKTLEFMMPYRLDIDETHPESMSFDHRDGIFNQPLGTFLPTSLETLWLSNRFQQPLQGVKWPSGLTVLGLGTRLTDPECIAGVVWPPRLKTLVLSEWCPVRELPPDCYVKVVWRRELPDTDEDEDEMDSSSMSDDADY